MNFKTESHEFSNFDKQHSIILEELIKHVISCLHTLSVSYFSFRAVYSFSLQLKFKG